MIQSLYEFLAQPAAGLAIAIGVLILAALAYRWKRAACYALAALGLLTLAGASRGYFRIQQAARNQPRGKLIDVGGYRIHLLAEGDARGGPTLVWLTGGHGPGLALYHLHKALRAETRSILVDRPGTGASDTGPFPRTTEREAEELRTALANAGETGPFVLLGHSYGGLLAANFARRYRSQTAAVVLLDPTPPDVFTYLPGGAGHAIPSGIVSASERQGLAKLFGLWSPPPRREPQGESEGARVARAYAQQLADVRDEIDASSVAPATDFATASLFREWQDPRRVASLLVYDGELGDLPLFLVCPASNDPQSIEQQLGLHGEDLQRATGFLQRARLRYLTASSRSELISTPAGTGHNFPYEAPEFTITAVRGVLAKLRR